LRSSQGPTRGRRAAAQPTSLAYGFPSAVPAPTRQGGSRGSSASQRRRPWDRPRCAPRAPAPRRATPHRSTGAAARDDRPARVGAAGAALADGGWRGAADPVTGTQLVRAWWIATTGAGHVVMFAKGGGLPFLAAEGRELPGGVDDAQGSVTGATRLVSTADLVGFATLVAARPLRPAALWWRGVVAANAHGVRQAACGFESIGAGDGVGCVAAHRPLPVLAGMAGC
jgi:hypothetical protein